MNILWVTLESLLPANSGGRIGILKRLEQVAKTEQVYLFYPYDNKCELKYVNELKKICVEVYAYHRAKNKKRALLTIIKYPFTVGSRCIPQMQEDIRNCLKKNKIDIINVDFPHMCSNLLKLNLNIPIVLNEHNIEWKVYKTISDSQRNIVKKIAYWIDSFRMKSYEKKVLKKLNINKVIFVSGKDMENMIITGSISKDKCELVPVGADILQPQNTKGKAQKGYNIIYVGKMSYSPNIEAVEWFVKEIYPLIREQIPNTTFYIVGKDPVKRVKELESENIIVTGTVDSINKYYEMADLVVLPLLHGGGMKVKLLEAISHKKAVVSTSVGTEGTLYSNGKTIPVIDEAGKFAEKCIDIMVNGSQDIAEAAYKVFMENYTWDKIGEKYMEIMNEIISAQVESDG